MYMYVCVCSAVTQIFTPAAHFDQRRERISHKTLRLRERIKATNVNDETTDKFRANSRD